MNRAAIVLTVCGLLGLAGPVGAADAKVAARPEPSKPAAELSARIDKVLGATWEKQRITPAEAATDAEFLRRVYLDLAGRIPTVAEARAFDADTRADKRRHLVAGLLARPTYAKHFTTVWRRLLLPEVDTNANFVFFAPGFDAWLNQRFAKNVPYDQMVRELLATPIDQQATQQIFSANAFGKPTPVAFYLAKEGKPENLAAASARAFLGIRLECAQCHNHPFAEWTRDQFWELAAFFGGIKGRDRGDGMMFPEKEVLDSRELAIPGTDKVVQANFPDGTEPQWKFKVGPRGTLAEWVTAKTNPYFARATVNRVWAHFFGIALVEPVDEMTGGQDTVVHHAELLDELAKAFVASKYDLRFLMEAVAGSRAYQLSSRGKGPAPLFSRHPLRGLSGEQLFDSLATATGQPDAVGEDPFAFFNGGSPRQEFLTKYGQQSGRTTDHETSIIQALTLMNGRFVGDATNPAKSELLSAVVDAPFLNDRSRVEAMYFAARSRRPTAKELENALSFVERSATGDDAKKRRTEALADVFWALLNSAEFVFNH